MSRCLSLTASCALVVLGAMGARHQRVVTTFAGVPVQNYREDVQEWMIHFHHSAATDGFLKTFCQDKCKFIGHPDEGGTAFVAVHATASEVEEMVRTHPGLMSFVEADDFDYLIPEVEDQDGEGKERLGGTEGWNLERIGLPERVSLGLGVHIYLVDTGVRSTHVEFEGRAIPTLDMTSGKLVECMGDLDCTMDEHGHGTHCAGIAAGKTVGVARTATIHIVKTLTSAGGPRSWQLSALDWIMANADMPAVISMSLAGPGTSRSYTESIGSATAMGIVVVVGAGNSEMDSCSFSPASVADAITVAATGHSFSDEPNARAGYSNFGECNDIFAPGTFIVSASRDSDTATETRSGTSMACPHVAGSVAALLAHSPHLGRSGVMERFMSDGKTGILRRKDGDPDLFLNARDLANPYVQSCRRRLFNCKKMADPCRRRRRVICFGIW